MTHCATEFTVRPLRAALVAGAALALTLVLAACGSSGGGSSPAPAAPSGSAAASSSAAGPSGAANGRGANGGFGGGFAPGTTGKIAAVTGTTMQVQGTQGQTAVSWTTATKFTHRVTVALSTVKAGDCITAVGAAGTSATAASFTAATITVTPATNGSCTGGFGGARTGGRPSGFPTSRPSNLPSRTRASGARPSGARPSGGGFGADVALATGSVKTVSGSTITVAARDFQRAAGASASPAATSTTKTITVGSSTTLTTTASTTAGAVKVGLCASAQGKADSSGAVAATSVLISNPTSGACTAGFGGRGR